jgi:hypothetical protein
LIELIGSLIGDGELLVLDGKISNVDVIGVVVGCDVCVVDVLEDGAVI